MRGLGSRNGRRGTLLAISVALLALALPAITFAHLERPSYWPDPRPDTSITPAAGGAVPKARSLESAVTGNGPGEVRVVCQGKGGGKSPMLLKRSIQGAEKHGYKVRPSESKRSLSGRGAERPIRCSSRPARTTTQPDSGSTSSTRAPLRSPSWPSSAAAG